MKTQRNLAVTLSGGGARAAYEAGVLRAISEMGQFRTCPFDILTGVSAGAINGMFLAAHADDFDLATRKLWDTWIGIRAEDVFKSDALTLMGTGARWFTDLSLGKGIGNTNITYLLDTAPLERFLSERIDPERVSRQVTEGNIRAVSLSATHYYSGKLVTFFDGHAALKPWDEFASIGQRTKLSIKHVMASTAIPIFFPPVVTGEGDYEGDYGDGGIGLRSPLSDAIHLGAEKIFLVSLQTIATNPLQFPGAQRPPATLGDIAGVMLNSLFQNSLESDLGRLEKINEIVRKFRDGANSTKGGPKEIAALVLRPSLNLGGLDTDHFAQLPFTIRHLLKGLGVSDGKGWELLSYLAFEKSYVGQLLELGYKDAMADKKRISDFLKS